ncbi:MAG TPA: pirin family protein [Rhizomicrobium sp.]|jgi:quercetin 2,3-dioxygenase|nr:pirin family protein [Rhizomicrobium sp.]
MITVRRSSERGVTKTDWLDSRHTFSFAEYDNPAFENFGALRVINEDRVAGGGGFPPHRHRDMEIVTYILEGALEHKDSAGGGGIIRANEIQRMSAGAGIIHAEFNASRDQFCHFMQIWIMPSKPGLPPSYEQKAIDAKAVANKLARIASSEPQPGEVRLVQDAEIWAAKLDTDVEAIHTLAPGRRAWVQVTRGEVSVDTQLLSAGDGAAVTDQAQVALRSRTPAEILLFDLA